MKDNKTVQTYSSAFNFSDGSSSSVKHTWYDNGNMTKDLKKHLSCPAGTGQFSLNCTSLRKGQYIIYINVDGNQYAEKVNVK